MFMSLLDTDQYTFTQQQAIMKLGYSTVPVVFEFRCRTEGVDLSSFSTYLREYIERLEAVSLTKDEYDYMRSLRYFSAEYLNFLKYFRFDPTMIYMYPEGKDLIIKISGPWFNAMPFEMPILYAISEQYALINGHDAFWHNQAMSRLNEKTINLPLDFKFADFGTRRRACSFLHDSIVQFCAKNLPKNFVGTSNLYLAKKHNVTPIGTMSHMFIQGHQQLNYRLIESQKMAFENWVKVYRGDLGYALADTINTEAFLKDFDDPLFYKLFDGVREDSEPDPIAFGHKIINFYIYRKINPKTKTIIFSNNLNFEKAKIIYRELHNLINVSFGIGTNLTNDTGKDTRLDIVIKMVRCNGQPVAKISNAPGKTMCDNPQFVSYLKSVFSIK